MILPTVTITTMVKAARALIRTLAIVAVASMLAACIYDAPITAQPTREVDPRLIGDWTSADGKEQVKVRKLDRRTYVIDYNGELFQAWHSDLDGRSLVSVQDLERPERKFSYISYELSPDGKRLRALSVSNKTIPDKAVHSPRDAQAALRRHSSDPKLFNEEPLELQRKR
ncbi:MAG TPA: hypothetical protein VMV45_21470 [Casimicrobiaceae bacterium]|nr:hypothetical protein [Casimicrobiaceae bacterium]